MSGGLANALKVFRKAAADQLSQPAFCVFSNKALDALVAAQPQSLSALQRVPGFGKAKAEKFGTEIVRICSAHAGAGSASLPQPSAPLPPSAATLPAGPTSAPKRKLPSTFEGNRARPVAPEPPPAAVIDRSSLNQEQRDAADRVQRGDNTFLTGAAGTGKSFLLRHVIQQLERRHPGGVAVTAPTGIAASHVQGVTIHSWAGIGLGKGAPGKLLDKVRSNGAASARWRRAAVLVIDEISMLDSNLFDLLDAIGRDIREGGAAQPFGGLQLVLCGDFFQLPPVSLGQYGARFAFQANAWRGADVSTIELRTVVRQSGDTAFIDLLSPVRVGVCSHETTTALAACHVSVKPTPNDTILPTKLYCTNRNVDEENGAHLRALGGQSLDFPAIDAFRGEPDAESRKRLLDAVEKKAAGALQLKVGAQVLLTKNFHELRLVNGSRGVVHRFVEQYCADAYGVPAGEYTCPVVRFDSGQEMAVQPASFFQGGAGGAVVRVALPLKLAWALTVHKSQGMSLSRAELMLDNAFDFGQVYVALSRVTSLAGLWVRGGHITQRVVMAHPDVLAFYRAIGCAGV